MTTKFSASLEVKGEGDGERLNYKNDGERFPEGQSNTIKLSVACAYVFTVTFRPAKVLTGWMMRGDRLEFERVQPSKTEEDVSIYQAHWNSTGVEVTKRGHRHPLPIQWELNPGLVMKSTLQTKFYPDGETTHRNWGLELHAVDYKCQVTEGHLSVEVLSEKVL